LARPVRVRLWITPPIRIMYIMENNTSARKGAAACLGLQPQCGGASGRPDAVDEAVDLLAQGSGLFAKRVGRLRHGAG